MAPKEKRPLDRFPVVRTDDVDEMRVEVSRFYGELRLSVARDFDSFHAHGNHCQLNDIGISYASFGAPVHQSFPNFSAGYAMPIAVAGSGRGRSYGKAVEVTDRQTLIGSPGSPVELHYSPDFETITVRLDAAAVQRTVAGLIGAEVNGKLVFDPVLDFENPVNQL